MFFESHDLGFPQKLFPWFSLDSICRHSAKELLQTTSISRRLRLSRCLPRRRLARALSTHSCCFHSFLLSFFNSLDENPKRLLLNVRPFPDAGFYSFCSQRHFSRPSLGLTCASLPENINDHTRACCLTRVNQACL